MSYVLLPFLKIKNVTFDFEHAYIKKWCCANGGSWPRPWVYIISVNPVKLLIKCNVFIFENKRQTGYDINIAK